MTRRLDRTFTVRIPAERVRAAPGDPHERSQWDAAELSVDALSGGWSE